MSAFEQAAARQKWRPAWCSQKAAPCAPFKRANVRNAGRVMASTACSQAACSSLSSFSSKVALGSVSISSAVSMRARRAPLTAVSGVQARLAARSVEGATIELRVIGQNATLGALETRRSDLHEVGVLAVVTAPDQSTATDVAKSLNPLLLHCPLTEHEPTPTFAFPFSPPEMQRGPVYEFCLHHVLALDAPCDAFRREVVTL